MATKQYSLRSLSNHYWTKELACLWLCYKRIPVICWDIFCIIMGSNLENLTLQCKDMGNYSTSQKYAYFIGTLPLKVAQILSATQVEGCAIKQPFAI